MSGIYLHIPFCKQACNYCDFHFSTSLKSKEELVDALINELDLRKNYLSDNKINTIYFGGGTPSLLSEKELGSILEKIHSLYEVNPHAEVTLECNPDDLSNNKLQELKNLHINRLSIGLQSFNEEELKWMNRAHTASESESSVKRAQDKGFENITIDLIYGSKFSTLSNWKQTLQKAVDLDVTHISSYNLTVEEKTKLGHDVAHKKESNINEEKSAELFLEMIDVLQKNKFIHYEISNFGKEGFFSKHNSNYWIGAHYVGIGPSAHSFNGSSRQWNVNNNPIYINKINNNDLSFFELEELTPANHFNEYILTSLRTIWGVNNDYLLQKFPNEYYQSFKKEIELYIKQGEVVLENNSYVLTSKGKLLADRIASELFVD